MNSWINNVHINRFFYTVSKDFTSQYTNYLSMKFVILVCFVDFLKTLSLFTTSMSTLRWYKYTSLFCRLSKCLLNTSHAESVSSEDGWGFGGSMVLSFSSWSSRASADLFILISSMMSSSVSSEQVSRSSSIVVKVWMMSGLSPCSLSLARGMLSSMSKSSSFLCGWGYRVGLCKSSVSEAVGDCRRSHAVPGLAQQMEGYTDLVIPPDWPGPSPDCSVSLFSSCERSWCAIVSILEMYRYRLTNMIYKNLLTRL